jgi:SAM-dependent methyltransferase
MMDVDWSLVAPGWDERRDDVEAMKAELTARMMAGLGPVAGQRVLELGAGTGELAAQLAEAVGPDGSVIATDAADGMVALLHKRIGGLANVEVARLDATRIELPGGSVDAVVFRMGLMLVPEPGVALAEIRRVLRPGGRFATAVWGGPHENPWMTTVGMAAMMHGLVQGGPPVGPGGPFSLADPDDLAKRVRDADFADVQVTRVESARLFRDSTDHVDTVLALTPNLGAAVTAGTPEQVAAVRAQVASLTEQFRTEDGLRIPTASLLCIAQ